MNGEEGLAGTLIARARVLAGRGWQMRMESSVALINLATVATGFLLQIIVLRMSGVTRDADAYFATAAIPQVMLSIAAHVMTGALMPLLARINKDARAATVRTMLVLVLGGGLPVAGLFYFTAPVWTFVIFPGFADDAVHTSATLAGLAVLATPWAMATSILSAYLYAQHRFLINEGIALGTAITLAVSAAILIPAYGIVALGWLVVARFATQSILLALLLPAAPPRLEWPLLKPVWSRARPLLAGALYFKSDLLVDRFLLSLAPAGALSIVVFGQSIFVAAAGVLGQALANTASPTLTIAHSQQDGATFRAVLRRNMMLIGTASGLLLIGGVALVPPVTTLLTKRALTDGGIELYRVLLLFGGVPIGACIGALLANAFYAIGDTRTPTVMSAITFTVFLAAKAVVFTQLSLYAFCALTSVYYLANATLLAWLLRRRLRKEFAA